MPGRKLRTKLFWTFLSLLLLLALLVAALPLWFPMVLRPIAKRFGATYADYRLVGYQRFQLSSVALTNGSLEIQAGQLTAFVPTVWLWRLCAGISNPPFLTADVWKYSPKTTSSSSSEPASAYGIFHDIKNLSLTLDKWLPTATLTKGTIAIQSATLEIPQAAWTKGNLAASVALSNQPPFALNLSTAPTGPWKLSFDWKARQLRSAVSISEHPQTLAVTGSIDWLTNHFDLAAEFPSQGVFPYTASLRAGSFTIPARLLGMREQYGDITGGLRADWETNHFAAQLNAHAVPEATNLPPLDVELRASGDTNSARIELARISAPGLQAGLSAPVMIQFQPPFISQPAALNVALDLDQQHWFAARGKLSGYAVVFPAEQTPRVALDLSGQGIAASSITTSNLEITGGLTWPLFQLKSARIAMGDGSKISLAGTFDLEQKAVRDGRFNFSGSFGRQFLPAHFSFDSASLSARFSGPLSALTNSALLQIKHLTVPRMNPTDVTADWKADGLDFQDARIKLTAGSSSLSLSGSGSLASKSKNITLSTLELSRSNQAVLHLQQPAQIVFSPENGRPRTNAFWRLDCEPLALAGDGRDFRIAANVNWRQRGTFQCDARGLDARLLKDFIPQADSEAVLNSFNFSGGWTNGPIAFQLTSTATLKTKQHLPFSANAKLTGGKTGIVIEQLSISTATQAVCQAEGSLPVFCDPTRPDFIQIDAEAPLNLQMSTQPNSVLWDKIGAATGLRLQEPRLTASLAGSYASPQGQVTMQARSIQLPPRGRPLPGVENLDFLAVLDRASVQVSRCNFQIEQQPVSVTAAIPLGESFWANLRHQRRLPDWREATAHLEIHNAQLAAFTSFLPPILSPQGSASADISLAPGGNLHGELSLTNARTFPLESIGAVRDMELLARLDGQTLRLERASAEIGGEPVNVDGSMELNEKLLRTNGLPPFQAHLTGTNVPLARNPNVLLRADLDLSVTNSDSQTPLISGVVKLRNSLYLADLQSLVPQHTASPRQRPPYFSVEAQPWAEWRLNLAVQGTGFLRVQTPIFQGKVSTVLNLVGTLKNPLALGQVQIDSGSTVVFPFGTLNVKQGFISLTSEDPYRPTLFVDAEARQYGYDVTMQITGPVDKPVIQFSSVPGLSSEEIVLMLTSGQIPAGLGATTSIQQRAEGLGLFVGKNLLSGFGLGGNGEQRLTIRSGEYISESGKPTYTIEYKLNNRWAVIGAYDRFDQYDLDLKWTVYSR